MYRDGNFQNLRWNMLEASHKAHWEKLSSVYGLEEPEKLLKSEAQKKDMPVLDQLAELCICSCQNYLFSLTPVKDVSNVFNDVLTAPDDLPMRIRRDMPHHFELALRDHLIVTFAYRFCCDNLEPRSFDDYVNTLFDYIAEFDKTANPIDLAEIRKNYRRDFRKDFRNKYRNFCEQFTLTTSESGGECSNNPQAGPADKPSENTTCKSKTNHYAYGTSLQEFSIDSPYMRFHTTIFVLGSTRAIPWQRAALASCLLNGLPTPRAHILSDRCFLF